MKKQKKSSKIHNPETVRLRSLTQSELNHWQTDLPTLQSVLMPSLLLIPLRHWLMQINTYSPRRCSFYSRISGMSGSSLNIMTLKDLCEVNKTHVQKLREQKWLFKYIIKRTRPISVNWRAQGYSLLSVSIAFTTVRKDWSNSLWFIVSIHATDIFLLNLAYLLPKATVWEGRVHLGDDNINQTAWVTSLSFHRHCCWRGTVVGQH